MAICNRWTVLTQNSVKHLFHPFFSVGQKLNILIHSLKLIVQPVEASFVTFLESVEVKGLVHI